MQVNDGEQEQQPQAHPQEVENLPLVQEDNNDSEDKDADQEEAVD